MRCCARSGPQLKPRSRRSLKTQPWETWPPSGRIYTDYADWPASLASPQLSHCSRPRDPRMRERPRARLSSCAKLFNRSTGPPSARSRNGDRGIDAITLPTGDLPSGGRRAKLEVLSSPSGAPGLSRIGAGAILTVDPPQSDAMSARMRGATQIARRSLDKGPSRETTAGIHPAGRSARAILRGRAAPDAGRRLGRNPAFTRPSGTDLMSSCPIPPEIPRWRRSAAPPGVRGGSCDGRLRR